LFSSLNCGAPPATPTPAPANVAAGGAATATEAIGRTSPSQPNRSAVVTAAVSPNPVPFSGAPITNAPVCAGISNTWFYSQTLVETGGVDVTITSVIDRIDGVVVNDVRGSSALRALGGLTYEYRWCFTESVSRSIQSTFSGMDANGRAVTVAGPVVVLQPRASSSTVAAVVITASPNPVPFSGTPITDNSVCAGLRNTWYYTQTLTETTGVAVSFSSVVDRISGAVLQSDTVALPLRARGSITYNYRWCLVSSSAQTAQATFSGVDATGRAVTFVGPVVTLQAGPSTSSTVQAGRRSGGGGTIP
jgi:hypothetical protein